MNAFGFARSSRAEKSSFGSTTLAITFTYLVEVEQRCLLANIVFSELFFLLLGREKLFGNNRIRRSDAEAFRTI